VVLWKTVQPYDLRRSVVHQRAHGGQPQSSSAYVTMRLEAVECVHMYMLVRLMRHQIALVRRWKPHSNSGAISDKDIGYLEVE
jgi:hypothetical protein